MIRSLYTAATGMIAQQTQIDTTSHNISNVNTIGYKKNRAEFADLMYQTMQYAGTPTSATTMSPTGMEVGLGVRPTAITKMFNQGYFKETGNNLDMTIAGNGFFQIQLPDGTTAYTRNGSFKLDGDGNIVNSDGYRLLPEMTIPADAIEISVGIDGTISVLQPGNEEMTQIGQIELASFINPAGLHAMGDNNFLETAASGAPNIGNGGEDGFGQIKQGFVEMSNVQLVEEMTDLITGQRAYFDVRDKSDRLIPRRKGMEISVQGLYLAPGEIKNMVIPLHRYYDLRKEGIYYVHASVSHNKLPREYHSSAQPLRISGGSVLWERTVGLPDKSADTSDETERTYSICKVEGDQRVKYYYLRVENDRRVYAVTRLGVVQSHMDFQAQVDMPEAAAARRNPPCPKPHPPRPLRPKLRPPPPPVLCPWTTGVCCWSTRTTRSPRTSPSRS